MGLLTSISEGFVRLTSDAEPQDVYAGLIHYQCFGGGFDGWSIVVFNDCNQWDYISSIQAPGGALVSYEQLNGMPQVLSHTPSADMAWLRYGIPGYLRFREEVWGGFKGERSETMHDKFVREETQRAILDSKLVALVDAVRAVPEGEDPAFSEDVKTALQSWHQYAAPMFAHSLDLMTR